MRWESWRKTTCRQASKSKPRGLELIVQGSWGLSGLSASWSQLRLWSHGSWVQASWSLLNKIYLFLREREREQAGEGHTKGKRENPKQAPHCQQGAQCGAWTHEPWDHDLSWNLQLDASSTEPPRYPKWIHLKKKRIDQMLLKKVMIWPKGLLERLSAQDMKGK